MSQLSKYVRLVCKNAGLELQNGLNDAMRVLVGSSKFQKYVGNCLAYYIMRFNLPN